LIIRYPRAKATGQLIAPSPLQYFKRQCRVVVGLFFYKDPTAQRLTSLPLRASICNLQSQIKSVLSLFVPSFHRSTSAERSRSIAPSLRQKKKPTTTL
jgi:hypothetical protein